MIFKHSSSTLTVSTLLVYVPEKMKSVPEKYLFSFLLGN